MYSEGNMVLLNSCAVFTAQIYLWREIMARVLQWAEQTQ